MFDRDQELTSIFDWSGAPDRWRTANADPRFKLELFVTLATVLVLVGVSPYFFQFVQARPGMQWHDPVLSFLSPTDLSILIVMLLYGSAILALSYFFSYPRIFLRALQAYVLLNMIRMVTIYLIPLEEPAGLIHINDPFLEMVFYQDYITKDLFFSGHVAILIIFGLYAQPQILKRFFYLMAFTMAIFILLQHAHYTIDILAAPFFAMGSAKIISLLERNAATDQH